ncbi:hypothetical protein I7I50_09101 [Histoplasma capsulatum G186AR]|uniref:Uncharacterized protein n=1 Tax=Ajellomyces capsulatus TaxID=5037 RepID=A0A8H7YRS8_AJECA|nr:hypothetical protein I7I52_06620 [Histoplasma capsulatum]QSS74072.1 hypothetical protein I7I50_09101 [Histoplasma capsulatum G186AR]
MCLPVGVRDTERGHRDRVEGVRSSSGAGCSGARGVGVYTGTGTGSGGGSGTGVGIDARGMHRRCGAMGRGGGRGGGATA